MSGRNDITMIHGFLKKISLIIIFIFVLIVVCFSRPVFPSEKNSRPEKELRQVIENIKKREQSLRTFSAKFIQTKKTCLLREPLQSEGEIYFDQAGKILFKVIRPSPMTVLLKKDQMQIYYPDTSKLEIKDIGNSADIIKRYFGIGQSIDALEEQYELSIIPETEGYSLQLKPKQIAMAKRIELIEIKVNPKTWLLERIHFMEPNGDYTTLNLHFTSVNEPIAPGIFLIHLPYPGHPGVY
jgi:outer membrane lipoprotein-sorting protein